MLLLADILINFIVFRLELPITQDHSFCIPQINIAVLRKCLYHIKGMKRSVCVKQNAEYIPNVRLPVDTIRVIIGLINFTKRKQF